MAPKAMELIGWPWQHNWAVAWAPTRYLGGLEMVAHAGTQVIILRYFKIIIIVIILGDLLKISVNHLVICNHRNQ